MDGSRVQGRNGAKKTRRKRSRYSKVPLKTKLIFFRKVIHEHGNLREIAKKLGIKYSTAKTLTRNYKAVPEEQDHAFMQNLCEQFDRKPRNRRRCSYRSIHPSSGGSPHLQYKIKRIQIICNSIKTVVS